MKIYHYHYRRCTKEQFVGRLYTTNLRASSAGKEWRQHEAIRNIGDVNHFKKIVFHQFHRTDEVKMLLKVTKSRDAMTIQRDKLESLTRVLLSNFGQFEVLCLSEKKKGDMDHQTCCGEFQKKTIAKKDETIRLLQANLTHQKEEVTREVVQICFQYKEMEGGPHAIRR
ncbi:hypothetical protein B9Z55_007843 [Caenorhabditis nigoni]|nr:hypothetical protein B9Z55_007843 [Caenorhabditis nigoni]